MSTFQKSFQKSFLYTWFAGLAIAIFWFAASLMLQGADEPGKSAVVKIELSKGHGSGVHIGNGYILTANHVLREGEIPTARTEDGASATLDILWRSKDYDIALTRVIGKLPAGTASLDCRWKPIGTRVRASGNPLNQEFLSSWGSIAGEPREALPNWKKVVPVNMAMVQGMSGGPAFNEGGAIIGINVGTMMMRSGFGATFTGFGMIVPAPVICDLLAR